MLGALDYQIFAGAGFTENNLRLAKINFAFQPSKNVSVKGVIFRPDGIKYDVDPDDVPSVMLVDEEEGRKIVRDT